MKRCIEIKPSKRYTRSIGRVIMAIALFFLLYLSLLGIAGVIFVFTVLVGIRMIMFFNLFAILFGAGLILLGGMLFFFLIKFLFVSYRDDSSHRFQVEEKDFPGLFRLIREVAGSVGMTMPRKVFLSNTANAGVFYNSSFWSLFIPIRKNLEIGLGLVGVLTEDEFKAVLAHEFGHFSQGSMRLGSYVYTVNRVVYNLAYGYDRWDSIVDRWRQVNNITCILATLTYWTVQGIRSILRAMYTWINLENFALSREMEFQADEYAVRLVGKEVTISALRKVCVMGDVFDILLETVNAWTEEKVIQENLYKNQQVDLENFGVLNRLEMKNGVPVINDLDIEAHASKMRVRVTDLWASHPTLKERERCIREVETTDRMGSGKLAWDLFEDPEAIQREATRFYFQFVVGDLTGYEVATSERYAERMFAMKQKYDFKSKLYKGFYDFRLLGDFTVEGCSVELSLEEWFHKVYSDERKLLIQQGLDYRASLELLGQVREKIIKLKFFEFDGKRYPRKKAKYFITLLEGEYESVKAKILDMDNEAYCFNREVATRLSPEMKVTYEEKYKYLMVWRNGLSAYDEHWEQLGKLQYFAEAKTSWNESEWNQFVRDVSRMGDKYKVFLRAFCSGVKEIDPLADEFLQEKMSFWEMNFDWKVFQRLIELVIHVRDWMAENYYLELNELLDLQVEMYHCIGLEVVEK